MKNTFFALATGILLATCTTKITTPPSENKAQIMIPKSSCYTSVMKQDTTLLKLEVFPNVITGILKYNFSQKDNNQGTLEGILAGDKIFADYTFMSEGKKSTREVAFLIKDNKIIEGFGEMKEENGKLIFKNRKTVNFSNGIKFSPIDCVENDSKFRIK